MTQRLQACAAAGAALERLAHWQARQLAVGEESLTDWLLFELADTSSAVRYRKFTRDEEGKQTGADWEWWFLFSDGCFGFRVQAKRVRAGKNHAAGLRYKNGNGSQIRKLRRDAKKEKLPALYVLYSPDSFGTPPSCPERGKGAFLKSATRIFDDFVAPRVDSVSDQELLEGARPLKCLFCCPQVQGASRSHWIAHWATLFPDEARKRRDRSMYGERDRPPFYVTMVLEADLSDDAKVAGDERLPQVSGVAVIDLRDA